MICFILLSGILATGQVPDPRADPKAADRQREQERKALLVSPRIRPISSPERVDRLPVQNLLPQLKAGESASDLGLAARFRVIDKPVPLDAPAQATLRRILMNSDSYSRGVSGCAFEPTVAFRHWGAGGVFVDVLIGEGCYQVAFAENGRELLGYLLFTDQAARKIQALVRSVQPEK
jgi:hypothetical protein